MRWDIALIPDGLSPVKEQKQERLTQINAYINLVQKLQEDDSLRTLSTSFPAYPTPLQALMSEKETNLYAMVLAPRLDAQDTFLRSVSPVFSVNHDISYEHGNRIRRISSLQRILFNTYNNISITPQDTRARITAAVLSTVGDPPDFERIQAVLGEKVHALCGAEPTIFRVC